MRIILMAGVAALALAAAGWAVAPPAWRVWQLHSAADDPAALSDLRLSEELTSARIASEIDLAIAAGDAELADSFVALAATHGFTVAAEQRRRLATLHEGATARAIADFGHGFWAGDRESGAAFAGALMGDVTGFGDLRDLATQGRKYLGGEPADQIVLTLAAAGLAISAATIASFGVGLPARSGLSAVKSAAKAGRLSAPLTASLTRVAVDAVDRPALNASLAAAARFDLTAARAAAGGIMRPAAMTRLAAIGQDAGAVYAKTGQRGLRQVLGLAENAGDIGRAAKLGAAKGTATRAVLKVLGRAALVLGALSLTAVGWAFALIGYVLALAMLAQRLGWWLGRRLMPRRKPTGRQTAAPWRS